MTDEFLREPRPSHTKPDRVVKIDPKSSLAFDEEIRRICREEWLSVLAKLWTALGKPVDAKRLEIYSEILGDIPPVLLELGVKRALQEHTYSSVPPPGAVYQAAIRDLGHPENIQEAINRWLNQRWEDRLVMTGERERRKTEISQIEDDDEYIRAVIEFEEQG